MKLITNILLITIVLGIGFPKELLYGFVHMAELIEHFQEHKTENKEISFLDFIEGHVGHPDHEHQDKHAHDSLPFNHSHQSLHQNQIWNIPTYKSDIQKSKVNTTLLTIEHKERLYYSEYSQDIWQPPNVSQCVILL